MKELYQGRFLRLILKDNLEVVDLPASVVVLAELVDRIILVRNYRPAASSALLELPAGWVEKGEAPEKAALRELEEETGYSASNITFLLSFYPSPGYTSEKMYLFLAKGLFRVREPEEVEEVLTYTRWELEELINRKDIKDAKTLIALLYYLYLLKG